MEIKEDYKIEEVLEEEYGLKYLPEQSGGFRRERTRDGFIYFDARNNLITNSQLLQCIKELKIPPAWEDVWISPFSNSHLQATGFDARGRKQYIYHPDWIKFRSENKFEKMEEFGEALPKIRKQVEKDLKRKHLDREKVMAAVVGLLDHTLIRIGNKRFEAENNSYGLTTLRNRHMKAIGDKVIFEFSSKRGIKQALKVTDSKLARVVRKCRGIPGYKLFQYYDESGKKCGVNSGDVNAYLKEITKKNISSKDFRTWGGSTYAVEIIKELDYPATESELNRNLTEIVKKVAEKLGNTAAVCRKYYLHPIVLEAYSNNRIAGLLKENPNYQLKGSRMLSASEKLFLLILKKTWEKKKLKSGKQ